MKKSILLSILIHLIPILAVLINSLFDDADKNKDQSQIEVSIESKKEEVPKENKKNQGSSVPKSKDGVSVLENKVLDVLPENSSGFSGQSGFYFGLGLEFGEPVYSTIDNNRYQGLVVKKVFSDYGASKSGIVVGDEIYKINDIKISAFNGFSKESKVKVLIKRKNKLFEVVVSVSKVKAITKS